MRVLFWSGNFWPTIGGAEVLAAALLPALQARGYEFLVVTQQSHPALPREATYKGIPIRRFPFSGSSRDIDRLTDIRRRVTALKRAFAPDMVHINAVDGGHFFHLVTAHAQPAPVLVTLHSLLSRRPVGRASWLAELIRSADWITGVSGAVVAEARRLNPGIAERSSVLRNGLDIPAVPPEPLPFDPPRLLCLGRLIATKGFDVALSAFALIARRFPGLGLVIAGNGPARPALEDQAARLNLGGAIEFVGWVEPAQVAALINRATIVVMPSSHEGLPLVALESAFMARPIAGTDAPGLSEAVISGQTGWLVEPGNSHALAEAIAFMLDHPAVALQMGLEARRRALEEFSWTRCVDAYDALYRSLTADVARSGRPSSALRRGEHPGDIGAASLR
jgi:glycogen(starch) synthase